MSNVSSEPKRQKMNTDSSELEWQITFNQTQGLRTLVEVTGTILTRINFRITYDTRRQTHFLCIDSIDPQHVCMIQARLICEKTANLQRDVDFCVDSSIFNLILKSIPTHYSIDLGKRASSADICIDAYEALANSHHTNFLLPTLVDDSETMQLSDIAYKYTIEIDLGTLRQIVKNSVSFRANQLDFSVSEPAKKTDGVSRTTFTIGSRGDATQAHNFHSATEAYGDASDTYVIRAATDTTAPEASNSSDTVVVYQDAFSVQYLTLFLKNMERQIITMRLSQDKPLIVHYPLGADKSYICFVLAPKTNDD